MKAIRFAAFGDPGVLTLEQIPAPQPGPREVLIDIEAACVTPGDWKLRAGHLKQVFPVALPCVPGRDGAGIIVATGDQVDYVSVGDAVCFVAERTVQGSYAEQIVRDAASIVSLPASLSFAQGAALMHAGTCAWIVLSGFARLERGQKILVHAGAGAIGGMAVQLARHLGAFVAATCSARNADYVRSLGADVVIEYDRSDFSTQLHDYDVVLDLIGGDVHRRSYPVLKRGGRLVCLKALPIEDRSAEFGVHLMPAPIHDTPQALAAVIDLARRGLLTPQISRVMPLAQAAEAHRIVQNNENSRGRVILDIRGRASQCPA